MISETDATILQKLKGLLETKQNELEGHNWGNRSTIMVSYALEFFCFGNTGL